MGRKNKNKRIKKATRNAAAFGENPNRSSPRSVLEESLTAVESTTIDAEKIVIVPPPPASKTRLVLTEGRKDLMNVSLLLNSFSIPFAAPFWIQAWLWPRLLYQE